MAQPKKLTYAEKKEKKKEADSKAAAKVLQAKRMEDIKCLDELNTFDNLLKARRQSLKAKEQAKAKQYKGKECMPPIEEEDDV